MTPAPACRETLNVRVRAVVSHLALPALRCRSSPRSQVISLEVVIKHTVQSSAITGASMMALWWALRICNQRLQRALAGTAGVTSAYMRSDALAADAREALILGMQLSLAHAAGVLRGLLFALTLNLRGGGELRTPWPILLVLTTRGTSSCLARMLLVLEHGPSFLDAASVRVDLGAWATAILLDKRLIKRGGWDHAAMVSTCTRALACASVALSVHVVRWTKLGSPQGGAPPPRT